MEVLGARGFWIITITITTIIVIIVIVIIVIVIIIIIITMIVIRITIIVILGTVGDRRWQGSPPSSGRGPGSGVEAIWLVLHASTGGPPHGAQGLVVLAVDLENHPVWTIAGTVGCCWSMTELGRAERR